MQNNTNTSFNGSKRVLQTKFYLKHERESRFGLFIQNKMFAWL